MLLVQSHSSNDWLENLVDQILVEEELVRAVGNRPLKMTIFDAGVLTAPIAVASIAVDGVAAVAYDAAVSAEVGSVDEPVAFDYCARLVVPCFSQVVHFLDLEVLG